MNDSIFCPNCFQSDCFNGTICYQCGYQPKPIRDQRALKPGVLLRNRYFLGRVLGIGGFGITYLAFDSQMRQRCAVKEYFPAEWAMRTLGTNMIIPNSQLKDNLYQHGKEVFVKEANILLEFQREPHIVNVRDFFEANGTAYLVMEYVQGATLSLYMQEQNGTLSLELANQMVQEVADSLHRVHKRNLLHRDISPDNIMYDRNGEMKLIDFGATREYAMNSPNSMSIMIKPGFAPIEQYSRSGRQGPHTDVYGLAATYYYIISGQRLPTAPDREAGVDLIPLKQLKPEIPDYVNQAINHALQKKWQDRTANMKEFVREMHLSHRKSTNPEGQMEENQMPEEQIPLLRMQTATGEWEDIRMEQDHLKIGRNQSGCQIHLANPQISWEHCDISYDRGRKQFFLLNHSGNRTYTQRGTLEKEKGVYLLPGEWFYLQTSEQQYVFYVEVR